MSKDVWEYDERTEEQLADATFKQAVHNATRAAAAAVTPAGAPHAPTATAANPDAAVKRGRGRPRKYGDAPPAPAPGATPAVKRGRGRPRRDAAPLAASGVVASPPLLLLPHAPAAAAELEAADAAAGPSSDPTAATAAAPSSAARPRGRPPKALALQLLLSTSDVAAVAPRSPAAKKRERPVTGAALGTGSGDEDGDDVGDEDWDARVYARSTEKRGRPPLQRTPATEADKAAPAGSGKRRGRPPLQRTPAAEGDKAPPAGSGKRRGRPTKAEAAAKAAAALERQQSEREAAAGEEDAAGSDEPLHGGPSTMLTGTRKGGDDGGVKEKRPRGRPPRILLLAQAADRVQASEEKTGWREVAVGAAETAKEAPSRKLKAEVCVWVEKRVASLGGRYGVMVCVELARLPDRPTPPACLLGVLIGDHYRTLLFLY